MKARTPHRSKLPLANFRVINFGWWWAAPALAQYLADMGAEVIKVETERRLDNTRKGGATLGGHPGQSFYAHNLLRNQLSITLDLAHSRARDVAKALVRNADIVIENFRPGVMKRFGIDYPALRQARPDVIMISLSAAGQTGPLAHITTLGSTLASLTGLDSVQGYAGEQPLAFGNALLDPLNAVTGAFAVLAALSYRQRTGRGQYIDMSQWEASTAILGAPILDYVMNRRVQGPMGNEDVTMAPHNVYPCKGKDAWVAIAVKTDREWKAFRRALRDPAWSRNPAVADAEGRKRNSEMLDEHIAKWTRRRTPMTVTRLLQKAGVAAFPAASDAEVFTSPHLRERGSWVEVQHPLGKETIYGIHWKLSATPGTIRRHAPLLGQDNTYVFNQLLGLSLKTMDDLRESKILH